MPANEEAIAGDHSRASFVVVVFEQFRAFTSLRAQSIAATAANHSVDVAIGMPGFMGAKHFHAVGMATENKVHQRRSEAVLKG